MLSNNFFIWASKRERGLKKKSAIEIAPHNPSHMLRSKMRIQSWKVKNRCLEHQWLTIDGRCVVANSQYKFARMISTLDVSWQREKCRVKVANAARSSSRTRAKLVTSDHSKFIYVSRATSMYPSFVHNFPTGISRYRQSCDIEITLLFLLIFQCLVDFLRMPG